jgi:hypothetical protein
MASGMDNITSSEQLKKLLEEKGENLGKVTMYLSLSKSKDSVDYNLRFLRFMYLEKDKSPRDDIEYDYGTVIFSIKSYTREKAFELIKKIFDKQPVTLDSRNILPIEMGSYFQRQEVESYYPYGYLLFEWPATYLSSQIKGNALPNEYSILARPKLPSFPDTDTAIIHLFNLNATHNPIQRQIEIVIPDYSCRIKEVSITEEKIIAKIESKYIPEAKIVAKLYCRYADKKAYYDKEDFRITNNEVAINSSGSIVFVDLSILSLESGQILDYRRFGLPFWHDYNGTLTIKGESGIEAIISQGEN